MDRFQYELNIKKVDALKTLTAKDKFIREMWQKFEDIGCARWWSNIKEENLVEAEYIYKCITKAIPLYTATNGLPGFITGGVIRVEKDILDLYVGTRIPSYEKFIDTFKYKKEIGFSTMYYKDIKVLSNIFLDREIPFSIDYSFSNSSTFNSIGHDVELKEYGFIGALLEIEELKRELPKDTAYSIIEDFLAKEYLDIDSSYQNNVEVCDTFITSMENLVTVANTFKEKYKEL